MRKLAIPGGNGKKFSRRKKLSTEGFKSLMRRLRLGDLKKLFAYRKTHGGWMPEEWSVEAVKQFAVEHEHYSPEELGEMLQVTGEEYRQAGPFRQLAPIDMSPDMRRNFSRIRANGRRLKKRKAMGMKAQSASLSQTRPWEDEGVSRRTWERRRNRRDATLAKINLSENDRLASARLAVERKTQDKEVSKISLCAYAPTDPRALAKLRHLEHLAELKNVPAPPCKPGGIRERAFLSVFARYEAAEEAA